MDVNENLKELLDQKGITQTLLSERTGIIQKKISEMVNSKRKITAKELKLIADAMNVDMNIFFETNHTKNV